MDKIWKYALSVAIAIFCIIALLIYTGVEELWDAITHLNPIWFLPMILVYSIDWLIRGLRWKIILQTSDVHLSIPESTMHTIIGNTANIVVPAKLGDLARVYSIKKLHNVPASVGLSSVFFDRVFDFIAVAILTICLLLFTPFFSLPGWIIWVLYGAATLAVILLALIILVITKPALFKNLLKGPLKKFKGDFDRFQQSFAGTVSRPSVVATITCLSVIIWSLEAVVTYLLAMALGIHIPIWIIFFIIMIANLTKTLPLTPGGIGPYEWVFSALFVAFGFSLVAGTSLGVIDHLFKNLFTIVCGGVAASWLGIKLTKISEESKKS